MFAVILLHRVLLRLWNPWGSDGTWCQTHWTSPVFIYK